MAFDSRLHTVVETTNLQATVGGRHNYSALVPEDLDNGSLGYIGDCVDSTNDTYNLLQPTTDLIASAKPVLIAHCEVNSLSVLPEGQDEEYYYNEAGKTVRAYELETGGKFTLTSLGITPLDTTAGVQEDNYVVLQDGSFGLVESATAPTGVAFYGKIEKVGHYPLYVVPNYLKDQDGNLIIARPTKVTIRVIKCDIA